MDVDVNLAELEDTELSVPDLFDQQFPSGSPSTPLSGSSSPSNITEELIAASFANPFVNAATLERLAASKRGPGRPRKDIVRSLSKPALKRKQGKDILFASNERLAQFAAGCDGEDSKSDIDELPYLPEKYPGKLCCFCNLGERSGLGQGDFLRLESDELREQTTTTPVPACAEMEQDKLTDVTSVSNASESEPSTPSGDDSKTKTLSLEVLAKKTSKYVPKLCRKDSVCELDKVGHSESNNAMKMLADGAYFYVHHMCAMWAMASSNLDGNVPAVLAAAEKCLPNKCSYCGQFGASIVCKMSCSKTYHLPCAAAAGCFMVIESFMAFCSDHLAHVQNICASNDINCRVCCNLGMVAKLIMCSVCGAHYHSTCIGLVNMPDTRTGWSCSQCSKCQVCRQVDYTESRSIKCEQCQKLYHATCLRPIISSIPKYGWKCIRCRVCTDCGSRTPGAGASSRWHSHYTICDSCYQQRNKGFSCPICHKAYRAPAYKEMVKCSMCNRFVHGSCDSEADLNVYHKKKENNLDYEYVCPQCKLLSFSGKYQLASNSMQNSNDSNDGPSSLSCYSSAEQMYRDAELGFEKNGGAASVGDSKYKSKWTIKDFARRGGKLAMQKAAAGMPVLFQRKRSNAGARGGKSRTQYLMLGHHLNNIMNNNNNEQNDRESTRSTEEDMAIEKKIVLCSVKDKFVMSQDLCVMCGSIGNEQERSLIACAQCGQCFHTYCVKIKLSKVILQKGWRCLDCTVCEGCGQKSDESRLLLCDECDISYHTYCMNPPLETVPQGNWKCKWCAVCHKCQQPTAAHNSTWNNGYLECASCASQATCAICQQSYVDQELIIQCKKCKCWLHCQCDNINSLSEAQKCDNGDYHCLACRPKGSTYHHAFIKLDSQNGNKTISNNEDAKPSSAANATTVNTPQPHCKLLSKCKQILEQATHTQSECCNCVENVHSIDGALINERGLNCIKSLMTEFKRKRKRNDANSGIMAAIESVVAFTGQKNNDESNDMKNEIYKDGQLWTEAQKPPPEGFTITLNEEGAHILRKKRQRNLQKLGIGGFHVRNRGNKKDDLKNDNLDIFRMDFEKKKKINRKKLKVKLTETFPSYMQEAFFGKQLLGSATIESNVKVWAESDTPEKTDDKAFEMFFEKREAAAANANAIKLLQPTTMQVNAAQPPSQQTTTQQASATATAPGNLAHLTIKMEKQLETNATDNSAKMTSVEMFGKMTAVNTEMNILRKTTDVVGTQQQQQQQVQLLIKQEMPTSTHKDVLPNNSMPTTANMQLAPSNIINHGLQLNIEQTSRTLENTSTTPHTPNTPHTPHTPHREQQTLSYIPNQACISLPNDPAKLQLSSNKDATQMNNLVINQSMSNQTGMLEPQAFYQTTTATVVTAAPTAAAAAAVVVPPIQHHMDNKVFQTSDGTLTTMPTMPQYQPEVMQDANVNVTTVATTNSNFMLEQGNMLGNVVGATATAATVVNMQPQQAEEIKNNATATGAVVGAVANAAAGSGGKQKTAEKMRQDEYLGDMATISAVLYANSEYPRLNETYPNWNERCKQIVKLWRSLSTEKKAPFLQRAKDNRSALRTRRSQQNQEMLNMQQENMKEREQVWKEYQCRAKETQQQQLQQLQQPKKVLNTGLMPGLEPTTNTTTVPWSQTFEAPRLQRKDSIDHFGKLEHMDATAKAEAANRQLRTLLQKQGMSGVVTGVAGATTSNTWLPDMNTEVLYAATLKQTTSATTQMHMPPQQQQQQQISLPGINVGDVMQQQQQQQELLLKTEGNKLDATNMRMQTQQQQLLVVDKYNVNETVGVDVINAAETDAEKLDQDEHTGFGDILGGLGEDDDDLLKSLAADDFNILEYADPELDTLATGQNILNKLDFDNNDKQ